MGDAPTEEEFKAAGIKHIFLKSTACAATGKSPVTDLSAVEADITSLGAVTGTSAKAKELVAGMKEKVDAVQKAVGGTAESKRPTYFFFDYDAGTKQPMRRLQPPGRQRRDHPGRRPQRLRRLRRRLQAGRLGGGDRQEPGLDPARPSATGAARQRTTRRSTRPQKWLKSNCATKGLKAVKEGHFLRIGSEQTTIAGVRNADTVEEIAKTLYPGKVG